MGYYIKTPAPRGKALWLIKEHGAARATTQQGCGLTPAQIFDSGVTALENSAPRPWTGSSAQREGQ